MSGSAEIARKHVEAFKIKPIAKVELLEDSVRYAEANPETVARSYMGYFLIVRHLFHLTSEETDIITAVNHDLVNKGAKDRGADKFLRVMSSHEQEIMDGLRRIGNLDIENNTKGLM